MCWRWVATVRVVMNSRSPIWALDRPCATRRSPPPPGRSAAAVRGRETRSRAADPTGVTRHGLGQPAVLGLEAAPSPPACRRHPPRQRRRSARRRGARERGPPEQPPPRTVCRGPRSGDRRCSSWSQRIDGARRIASGFSSQARKPCREGGRIRRTWTQRGQPRRGMLHRLHVSCPSPVPLQETQTQAARWWGYGRRWPQARQRGPRHSAPARSCPRRDPPPRTRDDRPRTISRKVVAPR